MTRNFTSEIPSIDAGLVATEVYGSKRQLISLRSNSGGGTAALTTCGSITGYRYPYTYTVPTTGAGVAGFMPSSMYNYGDDTATFTIGFLEYNLGSIALATGTFTSGATMPTKTIYGSSVQTAGAFCFLHCDAATTATTPTITTTYTNQDGTGSRTSTLVLPTSPILGTAFFMQPHLNNGDTAIRSVQNITKSAGTAGTISVRCGIPLVYQANYSSLMFSTNYLSNLASSIILEAGETIAWYRFGATSSSEMAAMVNLIVEPS